VRDADAILRKANRHDPSVMLHKPWLGVTEVSSVASPLAEPLPTVTGPTKSRTLRLFIAAHTGQECRAVMLSVAPSGPRPWKGLR